MKNNQFMLGYDYSTLCTEGLKFPLYAPMGHLICVGCSGSGKSTALRYWLNKIRKSGIHTDLNVMDFKASHEFYGITKNYAEYEACYEHIVKFYEMFNSLKEGGDRYVHILLIDEIAGLLSHYSMSKEGKSKADEIRLIMSSILMLGRSRRCFLWLAMQRYTASIFPSASGSADNFMIAVGMGHLSVDSRKSLFAGEHFEGEENLHFKQATGLVLIDGQPLQALIIPQVSKAKLLKALQETNS